MLAWLRRRLRIGIGGMMLAILAFGLWLAYRVNRAKELRAAVAAVKADGGYVLFTDQFAMGPVTVPRGNAIWKPSWGTLTPGKGPWAPAWLRRSLGDDLFREAAHVSLFVVIQKGSAGAPNNLAYPIDDVLQMLRNQSGIKTLQLGGETVTDKGLETVARMTDLRELVIWWATAISDKGVAHLGRLPRLRMVDISLSQLTDEGIGHLARLPMLEDLSVQGQSFSDQTLLDLSMATHLKSLILRGSGSKVTDKGIEQLKKLKGLRILSLEATNISPEARKDLIEAIPGLMITP